MSDTATIGFKQATPKNTGDASKQRRLLAHLRRAAAPDAANGANPGMAPANPPQVPQAVQPDTGVVPDPHLNGKMEEDGQPEALQLGQPAEEKLEQGAEEKLEQPAEDPVQQDAEQAPDAAQPSMEAPELNRRMRRKVADADLRFAARHGQNQPTDAQPTDPQSSGAQPAVAPPVPPLPLPNDPAKAIDLILETTGTAQDGIRKAFERLTALRTEFIDLRAERVEDAQAGGAKAAAIATAMQALVAEAKAAAAAGATGLARTVSAQGQLAGLVAGGASLPVDAQAAHAKATATVQSRVVKMGKECRDIDDLATKLEASATGDTPFIASDAPLDYKPDVSELPAIVSDLSDRLKDHTDKFGAAGAELKTVLTDANTVFGQTVKGNEPANLPARLDGMEKAANAKLKSFSKWNQAIVGLGGTVKTLFAALPTPVDPALAGLQRTLDPVYDRYTAAFGQADDQARNIMHVVTTLRPLVNAKTVPPDQARDQLDSHLLKMQNGLVRVDDPIGRLANGKKELDATRKDLDGRAEPTQAKEIARLEAAQVTLNRVLGIVQANRVALDRAVQEVAATEFLLRRSYTDKALSSKVDAVRKVMGQIVKAVQPAAVEGGKTEAGLTEALALAERKLFVLGPLVPTGEVTRLQGVIAALPPPPTKAALFPPDGANAARTELGKGGSKKGASLFATVLKAWDAVEKDAATPTLDTLEKAAAAFLAYADAQDRNELDPADAGRADKCREAIRQLGRMRLANDRASLPPPPWTEADATKARRIEACTLLDAGTPATPPSAKGESDSFFIRAGNGNPAFIFKPREGENVKGDGREGEGVVREVLSSRFNDQMKAMIGIDFGVCPTEFARLESPSFATGTNSQATARTGALQQATPNNGSLLQQCGTDPNAAAAIPAEDVQKIALLDFLSLQGDRNPENVLVREEGGQKRLVPIDGGFAFPSTDQFSQYSAGMAADTRGAKTGQVQGGQNGLMQLPQTDQRFSPAMLTAIAAIDPAAMVKGMKDANADLVADAPDLDGMVGDENLENMRRSALFLKAAAPQFTVAQLAEAYAVDFGAILKLPVKEVDAAITALLLRVRARINYNAAVAIGETEYNRLGGDNALTALGWNPKEPMLRKNWNRKITILQAREAAPPVPPRTPDTTPAQTDEQKEAEYKKLGGDKALAKALARPDIGSTPPKVTENLNRKLPRLRTFVQFEDLGGDAAWKNLVSMFHDNQYKPFHTLTKNAQAVVAALDDKLVAGAASDMGVKLDAMRQVAQFRG